MVTERSIARIAVLGAKGVGKTAIIVRFLTRRFLPEYQSGIETVYHYKEGNEDADIQIIDTCGNNDDLCMCADSIILVFSVTNRKSFEYIKNLSQWLKSRKGKEAEFTIIANKTDLSHKRQINRNEAMTLAKSINGSYFEISAAKDIEPIRDIFLRVLCSIEEILRNAVSDKRKKTKVAPQAPTEPKRKHSSIRDIFKKRPSV
eukprot:gene5040-150_t